MNFYSFLQKKHSRLFGAVFLAAVFIFSFSAKKVEAQNAYYNEFECLFAPLVGGTCDHSVDEASIKSGTKSGVTKGKTALSDATGVQKYTVTLGLAMDPSKELSEAKYFWSRIADIKDSFVVRIGYTPPGATKPIYKLQKVVAIEKDLAIFPLFTPTPPFIPIPQVVNLSNDGAGQQVNIPFYTKDGNNIITNQVLQATVALPNGTIPYSNPDGTINKITADFWYCGGLQDNAPKHDGRYAPRGPRVEYFTPNGKYAYNNSGTLTWARDGESYTGVGTQGLCTSLTDDVFDPQDGTKTDIEWGTAYYKIGDTVTIELPKDQITANTDQNTVIDTGIKTSQATGDGFDLPACGLINGTPIGCAAQIIYYVIYWPIAKIAEIIGRGFDFFLGYSISDESYRAGVIVTGWKLIRDISNIFFIIILVWTGLSTVFGFNKVSIKSVVPQLIINALLINFSLFGTRVVIDIANITARLFYNTMSVCDGACRYENGKIANPNTETIAGYKPLSLKIVSAFNPQRIFRPEILESKGNSGNSYAGYFIMITLIAAFIMFGIAKMLFSVMFMFVGRVIGLYMVMIFAPFAVVTRGGMPLIGGMKTLGWNDWLKELTSYSFLAPIFVFFLYIIYAFINSDFVQSLKLDESAGATETIMSIAIPMFLIYMLIQQGVKIAKDYSGKAGEMVQGFATKATGFVGGAALGVATGGLGLAGRGVASAVSKTRLSSWAAGNVNSGGLTGSVANMTNKAMRWSQKSSMDMRNTKLMDLANKGVSSFGVKLNDKVSGNIGLGAKDYVGGNLKIKADREKEIIEKASKRNDFSHLSDKEVEAVWDKYTKNKVGISVESSEEAKKINETTEVFKQNLKTAEANLQKAKSEGTRYEQDMATNKLNTSKKELEDRLSKEKEDKDKLYKEAIKKEGYGKVSNAKELSEAMRNDYAKSMLESSLYLSGGEKRTIPLGAGGAVGAIGSYATGLIGGLSGGALFTNYIDSLQESDKKAFEKITKDYKKAHSKKDNKILALQSKLEEIDSFVDSHIEGVLSGTGLTMEDIKKDEKLRETHFDRAKAKADREYVDAEEAYINAKNDYKSNKNTNTSTEFEKQARNYQKKKDNLNDLNNAKKNRDTAQNNLDKEKDRVKDKEDKTKGAEKKESDKPKDSK